MEESTKEEKFGYTSIFQPGALKRGEAQRFAEKVFGECIESLGGL